MRVKLLAILCLCCFCAAGVFAPGRSGAAQHPDPKDVVTALKSSLARSQQSLRHYEWVETTSVSLKGDEKSRKQKRCYYGAEGQVQKVPIGDEPEAAPQRGRLRGRVVAKKKGELTDYAEQTEGLVKRYVPPDPAQLQANKDAGKTSVDVNEQLGHARLQFRDYAQPGDMLGAEFAVASAYLLSLNVSTYLDTPKDVVTLTVSFGTLPDGTNYPAQIVLEMKAKNMVVTIQNSGYHRLS
jgi:hypothetical protein